MWSLGLVLWNRVETGEVTTEGKEGETQRCRPSPEARGLPVVRVAAAGPCWEWTLAVAGLLDRSLSLPLLVP